MRVGLAYNRRPDGAAAPSDADGGAPPRSFHTVDAFVEWDEPDTIEAVAEALLPFGEVVRLEAVADFPTRLRQARVDFLFNMAEGFRGPSREAQVPAIAEFLGIPYLGSDPLTLALALHKARAKEVWAHRGIPTAPFVVIETEDDLAILRVVRHYPLFLKPVWEGSSKGISEASYAETPGDAVSRAQELLATYGEPVLAEAFLPGDEFTAAVLGNRDAECLPLVRYRFTALPDGALPIMGYEAKWLWDRPDCAMDILECPADIPARLASRLRKTALAAYHALGCRDWARVDLRLDARGRPQVIEVNPLPGIIPDPAAHSCFPRAAAEAGMTHAELIQRATRIAWRRLTGRDLPVAPRLVQAVS